MEEDRLSPSDVALKELNNPDYLRSCNVCGRTTIRDAAITYEVIVGGWIVWVRYGQFGRDDAHRAAGIAFYGLSREQEEIMHEWADRILAVQKE